MNIMHSFKSGKCRKRKLQTLGMVAVVAILYFLLQFFSVSRLGKYQNKQSQSQAVQIQITDDEDANPHHGESQSNEKGEGLSDVSWKDSDTVNRQLARVPSVPRGVHPSKAASYMESADGMFTCLESQLRISIEKVNDDFCDCPDSSDEPGTSACQNGRFYCLVQIPQREPQFVHSSKVNDGICDCCDGSDEWAGQEVPPIMRLNGKAGAVFHTPCVDRCGDVRKLIEDERRIQQEGLLLQKRYLEGARQLSPREKVQYGPSGVFYLLSQQCYEHSTHEYRYTVCPFQSVKQSSGGGRNTVLGRGGKWKQLTQGDYLLTMAGGDAGLCPDGQPRQTEVRFLCGLEDHVINIQEDQKCRYLIRFSSPAAC